jgi:hypothetical protein
VQNYHRFGGICFAYTADGSRRFLRNFGIKLQGVNSHKFAILIFTNVRTSNPIHIQFILEFEEKIFVGGEYLCYILLSKSKLVLIIYKFQGKLEGRLCKILYYDYNFKMPTSKKSSITIIRLIKFVRVPRIITRGKWQAYNLTPATNRTELLPPTKELSYRTAGYLLKCVLKFHRLKQVLLSIDGLHNPFLVGIDFCIDNITTPHAVIQFRALFMSPRLLPKYVKIETNKL